MKVALSDGHFFEHSTDWSHEWRRYCEENGIYYELVDFYQNGVLGRLKGFDCMLWHFSGYLPQDMLVARSILYAAASMGIMTFPDFNTAWHFDDKIAETYLLESIKAPIIKSWVFYDRSEALKWVENDAKFPLVAKLRCGSGSNNVRLIKSKNDALTYIRRMFAGGYSPAPSFLLKAQSHYRSAGNWQKRFERMKRAPEFLRGLLLARRFHNEKGYVFFQEFIPNAGYDIKVAVVGDKCGFLTRPVRKNDFRASGGGALLYEREKVPANVVESAFAISNKLGFLSMGYDYVVDERDGIGKIVEMSYGFANSAITAGNGYWDPELNWHQEWFNPAQDVIKHLIASCR